MGSTPVFSANLTPETAPATVKDCLTVANKPVLEAITILLREAPGQPEVTPAEVIISLEQMRTAGLIESYEIDRGAIWHVSIQYRDMDAAPCSSGRYGVTCVEAMRKAMVNVMAGREVK